MCNSIQKYPEVKALKNSFARFLGVHAAIVPIYYKVCAGVVACIFGYVFDAAACMIAFLRILNTSARLQGIGASGATGSQGCGRVAQAALLFRKAANIRRKPRYYFARLRTCGAGRAINSQRCKHLAQAAPQPGKLFYTIY